jgi:outer membrane protein assembly factor BamB
MRRIPLVLLAAGLVVGIAVPFFWASRIPIFLGAALLVAAGLLARRRPLAALAGIVAAVALILAPGLINGWRNGQGIAWDVPAGESIELAEVGLAITADDDEPVLRARDIDSGAERWRVNLPDRTADGAGIRIWRAGHTLVVVGFDGALRGIGLDDGKVLWEAPPADTEFAGVTDGQRVAVTRCDADDRCRVESLSLQDGTVQWSAPVSRAGEFLGVPLPNDQLLDDIPLWPASFVVVPVKGESEAYVARDLATGKVLARGSHETELTGMLDDVLVRATRDGAVWGTDVRSGRELWRRSADEGYQPALSPMLSTRTLAMPEGALVLASGDYTLNSLQLGDALRLLDPRTGKVTEHPVDLPPDVVTLYTTGHATLRQPAILWQDYEDGTDATDVLLDGRTYRRDRVRDVPLTATEVGWETTEATWGRGRGRVVEVYDRRSGERVARYSGENTFVSSAGDRLIVAEGGDRDNPHVHVFAAR